MGPVRQEPFREGCEGSLLPGTRCVLDWGTWGEKTTVRRSEHTSRLSLCLLVLPHDHAPGEEQRPGIHGPDRNEDRDRVQVSPRFQPLLLALVSQGGQATIPSPVVPVDGDEQAQTGIARPHPLKVFRKPVNHVVTSRPRPSGCDVLQGDPPPDLATQTHQEAPVGHVLTQQHHALPGHLGSRRSRCREAGMPRERSTRNGSACTVPPPRISSHGSSAARMSMTWG